MSDGLLVEARKAAGPRLRDPIGFPPGSKTLAQTVAWLNHWRAEEGLDRRQVPRARPGPVGLPVPKRLGKDPHLRSDLEAGQAEVHPPLGELLAQGLGLQGIADWQGSRAPEGQMANGQRTRNAF